MKKNYMDQSTFASDPGNVSLSKRKFKTLRDEVLKIPFLKRKDYNKQYERLNQFLSYGDTQPAIVCSIDPLIISAYSDEMDAVLLLRFPDIMRQMYHLETGMRLVCSNVYFRDPDIAYDIKVGEDYQERYTDFQPMVQLFLADEEELIRNRVLLVEEETWERVEQLTGERLQRINRIGTRNGFFYLLEF